MAPKRRKEERKGDKQVEAGPSGGPLILVDAAHENEVTLNKGGKNLARHCGGKHRLQQIKQGPMTRAMLQERHADALFVGGPRQAFTAEEEEAISSFLNAGGGLIVALSEGQNGAHYLSKTLHDLGVEHAGDSVLAVTPSDGAVHPKDAMLHDCIINRALEGVQAIAYPRGCTFRVAPPAVPVLSTGSLAYPANRPIAAIGGKSSAQRSVVILGSSQAFSDKWASKRDNPKLLRILFNYAAPPEGERPQKLHELDAEQPDISDPGPTPDTVALAWRPRCALQEAPRLPQDFTQLFATTPSGLNLDLVPDASSLYEELGLEGKGLNLIAPQLDTPLPPLQPATFPPQPKELDPPPLELLDLDSHFQDERTRLSDVAARCTTGSEEEVAYMIRECSKALGIGRPSQDSPKHLLARAFQDIAFAKCSSAGGSPRQ